MSQHRTMATIRTWFWFIVLATLVGAVVSFVASSYIPPTYSSQATVLVSPKSGPVQVGIGEIDVARAAAATFSELARTRPVLARAIQRAGVDIDVATLEKAVTTRVPVVTSLLDITVTAKSDKDAAALANAIAAELVAYPTGSATQGGASWEVVVDVVDPAVVPLAAEGLGRVVTTALGAGIALLIAISLAILIENLRRAEDELPDDVPTGSQPTRAPGTGGPVAFNERGEARDMTG